MPYILTKSNGTQLTTIQDGSLDNSTDLTFVGKNYAGYGQIENENLVKLLENFANTNPPAKPVVGQIWYDSVKRKIKFYAGTGTLPWKEIVTGNSVSTSKPDDQVVGDMWWDPTDQKLYVFNGLEHILVGPLGNGNSLVSSVISSTIAEALTGNSKQVLKAVLPLGTPAIFSSSQPFNVDPTAGVYSSYPKIANGITLPNTAADGVSSDYSLNPNAPVLWGTAASAWGLVEGGVRVLASSYVKRTELQGFTNALNLLTDDGITVGTSQVLRISASGTDGLISNIVSDTIKFYVQDSYASTTKSNLLTLSAQGGLSLTPGAGKTVTVGTTGSPFADTYSKVVHTGKISTSNTDNLATTGTIYGSWTVYGSLTLASGSTVAATSSDLATKANTLLNATGDAYVGTTTSSESGKVAQFDSTGALTVGNLTAKSGGGAITGAWTLASSASLQATSLKSDTRFVVPDVLANNWTLAQRDGSGNLAVNALTSSGITAPSISAGSSNNSSGAIYGQWTLASQATLQATYADIAERYEADREDYLPGCVMVIGGIKEITASIERASINWAGIISTNPAFKLNCEAGDDVTHPYVALKGRVPCMVVGPINKGDLLVTSRFPGHAEAWQPGDSPLAVIAKALESVGEGTHVIEVKV